MMDLQRLAQETLDECRKNSVTIATAESCTGGMVSAALTAISGSSDVVDSGFVTYSNSAKHLMLGVCPDTLKSFGAVSRETAIEMADGALKNSAATCSISITGIAGPGGSDFKPEGRVCFGLALKGHDTKAIQIDFGPLGRDQVRIRATEFALQALRVGNLSTQLISP